MTTINQDSQTCAVCGTVVECLALGSTYSSGSPDLDLRLPEIPESTMNFWLQECPKCRFVNYNLRKATPNAASVLKSEKYQQLVADTKQPKLARKFACYAELNAQDHERAGFALLHSAWVCDDLGATTQAIAYRNQAADLLISLQPFDDNEKQAKLGATLVDVLRRALRFPEAKSLAETLLSYESVGSNKIIAEILDYQTRLCDAGDADCHTIADATGEGG